MLDDSYKALIRVSLPVMMSMLIQFAIFITDAAFLGRLSDTLAFDAVNTAGLIILTLTSICYGIYHGTQILIAKYVGRDNKQISTIFYNAGFILVLISLGIYGITLLVSEYLLGTMIEHVALQNAMNAFLNVRGLGFVFSIPSFMFLAFYTGIAQTRFLVWQSIVVASANIFLDYTLIFGNFGAPEMGMMGAAWASNAAELIGLVFGIFYIANHTKAKTIIMSERFFISKKSLKNILKTSSPLMVQGVLATLGWSVFFFLIEKIGLKELSISQVIRNIYYFALVPIIGFSSTTKTYISNFMSHNADYTRLFILIKKLILLSFGSILMITLVNLIFPEMVIRIITNKPELIEATVPILRLISGAMCLFSFSAIFLNTIAGAGKTIATMIIEAITIAIYLSLTYYVTVVNYTSFYLVWSMEYLYFILLAVFSLFYIFKTKLLHRNG